MTFGERAMEMANTEIITCPVCFQTVPLDRGRLMMHQAPGAAAEHEMCSTSGRKIAELFVCDICGEAEMVRECSDGLFRCPNCRKLGAELHGESL